MTALDRHIIGLLHVLTAQHCITFDEISEALAAHKAEGGLTLADFVSAQPAIQEQAR